MRVLNAYAGIGGNRHLWPQEWKVTAVELDERIAAEYSRRYPNDIMLVEDAHEVVMTRSHEFDATWSSPPCPSHSRLAKANASRHGRALVPDPRLWQEIDHLRDSGARYVVENVHVYYPPPTPPDVVTQRHWYWVSTPPLALSTLSGTSILKPNTRAAEFALAYGLPALLARSVSDGRGAMRNAVVPIEGLEIAIAAFSPVPFEAFGGVS